MLVYDEDRIEYAEITHLKTGEKKVYVTFSKTFLGNGRDFAPNIAHIYTSNYCYSINLEENIQFNKLIRAQRV